MDYSGFMNTGPNKWEPDPTSYRVPDLSLKMDKVYAAGDYLIIDTPSIDLFIIVEPYARKSYLFQTDKYTIDDLLMNLIKEGFYEQLCKECNPIEIVEPVREVLEPYEVRTRTYKRFPIITIIGTLSDKSHIEQLAEEYTMQRKVVQSIIYGTIAFTLCMDTMESDLQHNTLESEVIHDMYNQKIAMSDEIVVIKHPHNYVKAIEDNINFAKSLGIPVKMEK